MRGVGLVVIAAVCLLPGAVGVALRRLRRPRLAPLVIALHTATVALLLMALVIDPLRGTWEDAVGMAGAAALIAVVIVAAYAPVAYAVRRLERRLWVPTVAGVAVAGTFWLIVLYGVLAVPVLQALGQCPPPGSRVGAVCEFG